MVILPLIASAFIGSLSQVPPFNYDGEPDTPLVYYNYNYVDNSTKLNNNELDSFTIGGYVYDKNTLTSDFSSYVFDFAFSIDNSTQDFYVNGIQYVGFREYSSTFNAYDNLNADFSIRLSTEEGDNSLSPNFNMYIYPTYNAHPAEGYTLMQQLGIKSVTNCHYNNKMVSNSKDYLAKVTYSWRQDFSLLNFSDSTRYLFTSTNFDWSTTDIVTYNDYFSFSHTFQFYSTYSKNVGTYQDGYNIGYDLGYNNGLNDGISKSLEDVNPMLIAFNSIGKVLDLELFPGFKLSYGIGFAFACGIVLMILKFFH